MSDSGKSHLRVLQFSGAAPRENGDGSTATFVTVQASCRTGLEIDYAFFINPKDPVSPIFVDRLVSACENRCSVLPLIHSGSISDAVKSCLELMRVEMLMIGSGLAGRQCRILNPTAPIHRLISLMRRIPTPMKRNLQAVTTLRQYNLIQVDYPWLINSAEMLPRIIPRVFVVHELQSAIIRQICPRDQALIDCTERAEKKALEAYDAIITLCEEDADFLRDNFKLKAVFCSPLAVEMAHSKGETARLRGQNLVLSFLGGFQHSPNADGLRWLRDEIGPAITRQFPHCIFKIVGKIPQEFAQTFGPQFQFTGYVDDPAIHLHDSIFLCPIRIGSGMRIKILSAIAAGAPVVSTTLGARGLGLIDGQSFMVADTAGDFVARISTLLSNDDLANDIANSAKSHVHARYSLDAVGINRSETYHEIIQRFKSESTRGN